jgi:putative FmdB family regulatory protein
MPTYEHICTNCDHEWDAFYSIKASPPTVCPKCNASGTVKRLVSGGSGRHIVTLGHHETIAKAKTDAKKFKRAAARDENLAANFVGEDKYHNNKIEQKKLADDLKNI